MITRKCKITFIRHGSTVYTDGDILNDDINYPPLNELGRVEMEQISKWIQSRGLKVDKIYSSESCDCIKSAGILAKVLKQDFEIIPNLYTRRAGKWNGLSFEQIMDKYPEEFLEYKSNKADYAPQDGESLNDLNERVNSVISNLIKDNLTKRLVVVTNRDVIQSAVAGALNIPARHQTKICVQSASATQVSYFKDFSMLMYSNYFISL